MKRLAITLPAALFLLGSFLALSCHSGAKNQLAQSPTAPRECHFPLGAPAPSVL